MRDVQPVLAARRLYRQRREALDDPIERDRGAGRCRRERQAARTIANARKRDGR